MTIRQFCIRHCEEKMKAKKCMSKKKGLNGIFRVYVNTKAAQVQPLSISRGSLRDRGPMYPYFIGNLGRAHGKTSVERDSQEQLAWGDKLGVVRRTRVRRPTLGYVCVIT